MVTTLALTEQNKEKLFRFFEYNTNNMIEIMNDDDIDDDLEWKCNDFRIWLRITYDDDDNKVYEIDITLHTYHLFAFTIQKTDSMIQIIAKLTRGLYRYKTKKICDCGLLVTNNEFDLCSHCYVNFTDHDFTCPICLETEPGVWVKNKSCQCTNYYHYPCLKKVKKCPTCRCNMDGFRYLADEPRGPRQIFKVPPPSPSL